MRAIVFAIATVVATAGVARAQPVDVPALIKLVETTPTDVAEKSAWKEKRRDAAKKLAASKDKRAVPVLIRLAESETFDIIGEIAIEGLGNLGDQSAVPTLQKIANDPQREKSQQELAKKALKKLGAPLTGPAGTGGTGGTGTGTGGTGTGSGTGGTGSGSGATGSGGTGSGTGGTGGSGTGSGNLGTGGGTGGTGGSGLGGGTGSLVGDGTSDALNPRPGGLLVGEKPTADMPALPNVPDDALSAYERLTFAAGAGHFQYDGLRQRTDFDLDLAGHFAKRVERPMMAWGFDLDASVVAGGTNPDGRAKSSGQLIGLGGRAEARFYVGGGSVYGIGAFGLVAEIDHFSDKDAMDPMNDLSNTAESIDAQLRLGGGFGRMQDVGGAIRIRRISHVLDAARALGKPIDAATTRKLELTWWALRSERSTYRALVATVAILREAGILLAEPDAGMTYELLAVLRDSNLYLRPSGIDIQLTFGESYLVREVVANEGRVEQVFLSAGYAAQLADDLLEVSGGANAQMRILAEGTTPSPMQAGLFGRVRKFSYGDHGDPFGALDLTVSMRISQDDQDVGMMMTTDTQSRIEANLGFTYWMNQASGLRLSATVAEDSGIGAVGPNDVRALFIGAKLEATYGFLDGTFSSL